ncbi:MAG: hypothetical protein FWD15_05730 [Alphaproteobacteria bacterium]|nr:hypothetical protein [Alphaproteobacteria bacterium]
MRALLAIIIALAAVATNANTLFQPTVKLRNPGANLDFRAGVPNEGAVIIYASERPVEPGFQKAVPLPAFIVPPIEMPAPAAVPALPPKKEIGTVEKLPAVVINRDVPRLPTIEEIVPMPMPLVRPLPNAPIPQQANERKIVPIVEKVLEKPLVITPAPAKSPDAIADMVIAFGIGEELLQPSHREMLNIYAAKVLALPEYTLRITAYYAKGTPRGPAFSRLLNVRKALTNAGLSANSIMIATTETAEAGMAETVAIALAR